MELRYYQQEAIAATWRYLRESSGNPCVVIPTGGGKTPVLATMARDAVTQWGGRVVILAHVKELLEQSIDKLRAVAPDLNVGAFSAGLKRKDTDHDVIVAGIQSVAKYALDLGCRDLVFIDEAHLIPPEGEGRYRQFLADLRVANPHFRAIGLTATPYRMRTGPICGPENILTDISYEVGVRELIMRGFLCPLVSKKGMAFDGSGLKVSRGEFDESAASDLMIDTVEPALDQLVERAADRRSILVFATGIDHANRIAEGLRERTGQRVEVVTGKTSDGERAAMVRDFKGEASDGMFAGDPLRWLVNVGVFTTGFDAPNVDCVALLRPTLSPGLYYQMVGRGFRLCDGKTNCLVLDFGGNVERHGPVDALQIDGGKSSKGGEAPVKECPECGAFVGISFSVCLDCGYTWPPPDPKPKHEARPTDAAVTTLEIEDEEWPVDSTFYAVHTKRNAADDAPKTMRVDYYNDGHFPLVSEWVCIEHTGFAGNKARKWWERRSAAPFPSSSKQAVEIANAGGLAPTVGVTMRSIPGEKFPKITGYDLGEIPPAPEISEANPVDDVFDRFAAAGQVTVSDVRQAFPEHAPDDDAAIALLTAVADRFEAEWATFPGVNPWDEQDGIMFPAFALPDDDVPF